VNQPKLPITKVPGTNVQHFRFLIDANGIIGPDGQPIPITSEVGQTQNKKQVTAIIDTGFSTSQVPKYDPSGDSFRCGCSSNDRSLADDIYSKFPGAEFRNVTPLGNIWALPCTTEVNVTWKIGGVAFPMHPLDTL
jgi:hypothetical protein